MKNERTGISVIFVIFAGVCWGIISIFIRKLDAWGFDSFDIMFFRAWVSALFLFIYLLITKRKLLKISLKDIWMFIGTGLLSLTFFTFCYFTTIVRSGASVAVVLLYTSPIFVMLMSAVVFKEKITLKKIVALIVTFVGCILVAGIVGSGIKMDAMSLLIGLGAGFGYALYSIFAGFAVKKYSSITITLYTLVFSGVALLFICKPGEIVRKSLSVGPQILPYILGIALLCTVAPYLLYTFGLKYMEKSRAAVLVTVEPLVGTLLGIFAYKEDAGITKLVGIALIFVAVILLSVEKKHK